MKTVCPHCLQKYDVPDDYLQQDVTCQKCEKDFTVTKAKFCSGCGTPNATQGFTCWKCHEKFPITINSSLATSSPESPIENPGNSHLGKERISSADSLSPIDRWILNVSWAAPIILLIAIWLISHLYWSGVLGRTSTGGTLFALVMSLLSPFILINITRMFHPLSKSYRKIFQTPFRKICLWCYAVIFFPLILLSQILNLIQEQFSIGKLVILLAIGITIYAFIYAWRLFNIRVVEDEDFIETDIPESKYGPLLGRISGAVGTVGLILPPLGLIAIIVGIIALRKGQKKGLLGIIMGAIDLSILIIFLKMNGII